MGSTPGRLVSVCDKYPSSSQQSPTDDLLNYRDTWYFGHMSRTDTNICLLQSGNGAGSFLVRKCGDNSGFCLSVRGCTLSDIRHYKIHSSADKTGYFLDAKLQFSSIAALISFHSRSSGGLCSKLIAPAQRTTKCSDIIEIEKSSLELKSKISEGYFGEVHEAVWDRRIPVAVKILKEGSSSQDSFHQELTVLASLGHPNVLSVYGACTEKRYIVTELMNHGDLRTYLRKAGNRQVPVCRLLHIAREVLCGMEYLETQNWIHCDLAARNVLLGGHSDSQSIQHVKIADFGLARKAQQQSTNDTSTPDVAVVSRERVLPYKWAAPEAVRGGKFSHKSDVWSFGVLLVETFTRGTEPYQGMTSGQTVQRVTDDGYRHPRPSACPRTVYSLMLQCWASEPADRPTFSELRSSFAKLSSASDMVSWKRDGSATLPRQQKRAPVA